MKTIFTKLWIPFLSLCFVLGISAQAREGACQWEPAKIAEWEKGAAMNLIEAYLDEQLACWEEKDSASIPQFLTERADEATRSGYFWLKGCVLERLGHHYRLRKEYPSALHYFLEEANHWSEQQNDFEQADALLAIADLYSGAGNFSKAYTYLLQAHQHYHQVGLKGPIASTASRLGFYHKENAQHDSAFFYLEQAQLLQKEINDLAGLVYTTNHLGRIYKDKGDFPKANTYYQKALEQARTLKNRQPEAWTLINLGFLAFDQLEYEKAKLHFEDAKRLADEKRMTEILRLSCEGIYRLAEQAKDFERAFHFYRRYQELSAPYRNNPLTTTLTETEWRYQQELLQKELEIDQLARRQDQLWMLLGGLTSILLLTLLGLSWFRYRRRLEKVEKEKEGLDLEIEKYQTKNHLLQERIVDVQKKESTISWNAIEQLINEQYPSFKTKLLDKHPKLSEHDLRFCMLLLSSFSTKEIAGYFNISPASANKTRYRLRRKLGLSREENLLRYLAEQI